MKLNSAFLKQNILIQLIHAKFMKDILIVSVQNYLIIYIILFTTLSCYYLSLKILYSQ